MSLRLDGRIAALATVLAVSHSSNADESMDSLLDGVIARASAVFNARVRFDVGSKVIRNGERVSETADSCVLAVSGEDWLLRHKGSPNFLMNRDGSSVRFYRTESKSRGPYETLHLDAALTITEAAATNDAFSVIRNGTLWYPRQARFIDQQRHRAQRRGEVEIDGVTVTIVQWHVTAKDFADALIVIPPGLQKDLAGHLRLHVAPALGHALPRIEYRTLGGNIVRGWESSQFDEVDDGIYFPRVTRCSTRGARQQLMTTFEVHEIEHVNRPLPEQAFSIAIPPDTRVRDSRPGVPQSVFRLEEGQEFDEIVKGIETPNRRTSSVGLRVICLLLNGFLIGLLLLLWVRRKCRSS